MRIKQTNKLTSFCRSHHTCSHLELQLSGLLKNFYTTEAKNFQKNLKRNCHTSPQVGLFPSWSPKRQKFLVKHLVIIFEVTYNLQAELPELLRSKKNKKTKKPLPQFTSRNIHIIPDLISYDKICFHTYNTQCYFIFYICNKSFKTN